MNVEVPAPVAVPLITPDADRPNPVGSEPAVIAKLLPPAPPVVAIVALYGVLIPAFASVAVLIASGGGL